PTLTPTFFPYTTLFRSGTATYGLELFRAVPDLDAVYVPIGQGSGICGVLAARDALGCRAEVIGVGAANAPAYALSLAAGRPVARSEEHTSELQSLRHLV